MDGFPTTIKIGWCDFDVLQWDRSDAVGAGRYGEINKVAKLIRVDTSQGARQSAETLMHEILHGVYSVFTMAKDDDEERLTEITSHGLCTVIRDNPSVFSWIAENLK